MDLIIFIQGWLHRKSMTFLCVKHQFKKKITPCFLCEIFYTIGNTISVNGWKWNGFGAAFFCIS